MVGRSKRIWRPGCKCPLCSPMTPTVLRWLKQTGEVLKRKRRGRVWYLESSWELVWVAELLLTGKSGTAIMVSAGNGVIIFWMNREDRVLAAKEDAWGKCCPALPCRNITKTSQAKKNPSRKSWPCSIRMPRPGKPSVALPIFLEKQFP